MDAPRIASAAGALRHVFIRDLTLAASIGVHAHERATRQPVRINIDLGVEDDGARARSRAPAAYAAGGSVGPDVLSRVVDYEVLADRVRALVAAGHVFLVETLAERIAEACLIDRRVLLARVRVEKLAVFADAASAGVEIERRASDLSTP
ncbi:MAG: dihydroneopterin aldolase [Proteobacteria bacterium]|nr:dihydroneopterin aldolase [Pseudomonadota bacterium]